MYSRTIVAIPASYDEEQNLEIYSTTKYLKYLKNEGAACVMSTAGTSHFNVLDIDEIHLFNKTLVEKFDGEKIIGIPALPKIQAKKFIQEAKTYLDSQSIKNAQGVVLEGFWPQVKNEWVTRGERGKAAELRLAMSLVSEDPTKLQEIIGMSREEVAKEMAKYLENSVSKSEVASNEMLE